MMTPEASDLHKLRDEIQELSAKLEREHNLRLGLRANLELQANKIQKLISENEELGADRAQALELFNKLLAILGTDEAHAEASVAELRKWKELGEQRLAPTLDAAQLQADILWSYVKAMQSPGHRLVAFLGGLVRGRWLGRKVKSMLAFLMALHQA
jgi:hypothetical protein